MYFRNQGSNLADAQARAISHFGRAPEPRRSNSIYKPVCFRGIDQITRMQRQIDKHAQKIDDGMSGLKSRVSATLHNQGHGGAGCNLYRDD